MLFRFTFFNYIKMIDSIFKCLISILPFLLIFMLVLAVVKSFLVSYAGKDLCLEKCKILSITMILAHLQLIFGIILFYKKSSEILMESSE